MAKDQKKTLRRNSRKHRKKIGREEFCGSQRRRKFPKGCGSHCGQMAQRFHISSSSIMSPGFGNKDVISDSGKVMGGKARRVYRCSVSVGWPLSG